MFSLLSGEWLADNRCHVINSNLQCQLDERGTVVGGDVKVNQGTNSPSSQTSFAQENNWNRIWGKNLLDTIDPSDSRHLTATLPGKLDTKITFGHALL